MFPALLWLAGCTRAPRLMAVPAGQTVLAFGDSVTHGTGASAGQDWPTLLATLTGWRVINAGIPGDTAENGRHRLPPLLAEHRPALVIIEIGGNDFLRRRPANAVKEDLRDMVRTVRQMGAQVALVAVPELSLMSALTRQPTDAPLYEELAKEEGVALVPDVFSSVLSEARLRADQIHPNAEGYRQLAGGIHAQLKSLGAAP